MFEKIAGNERVKEVLKRIFAAGRLPGALLFVGEEGIGKKLFALEVARALNCRTPTADGPCGTCSACTRISKINYPETAEGSDEWKQILWTDHPDVGIVVPPKRVLLVTQMRVGRGDLGELQSVRSFGWRSLDDERDLVPPVAARERERGVAERVAGAVILELIHVVDRVAEGPQRPLVLPAQLRARR